MPPSVLDHVPSVISNSLSVVQRAKDRAEGDEGQQYGGEGRPEHPHSPPRHALLSLQVAYFAALQDAIGRLCLRRAMVVIPHGAEH